MKKHRALKITGIVLAAILLFFIIINVIPPKKNVIDNPFVVGKGNLPMKPTNPRPGIPDCICQAKVDTKKPHYIRSPVRFCTELGFYSPKRPQAVYY